MAQKKISELTKITSVANNDLLVGVDTSETATKSVEMSVLKNFINTGMQSEITSSKKLNVDLVNGAEKSSNKTNVLNESSTEDQYPNAKIVFESIDSIEKDVEKHDKQIVNINNRTYRIENNIFESQKTSDELVHVEDSEWSELQRVEFDGYLKQETSSGKQLFNIYSNHQKGSTDTSQLSNVQVKYNEDGSITLNGTATQNYDIILDNSFEIKYETGKDYYMLIEYLGGSRTLGENAVFDVAYISYDGTNHPVNINVPTSGKVVSKLQTYSNQQYFDKIRLYQRNSGNIYNNFTIRISVTNDSNSSYEPYTGGQPSPNPTYEQPIEVVTGEIELTSCNENLIDISQAYLNTTSGGITLTKQNDKLVLNGTSTSTVLVLIPFKGATTGRNISLKINNNIINTNISARLFNTPSTPSIYNVSFQNLDGVYNITPTSDANYFGVRIPANETISNLEIKPMIVFGTYTKDIMPTFVNGRISTLKLTLPNDEFVAKFDDTYKDSIDIRWNEQDGNYHAYLKKQIGKIVLDGGEIIKKVTGSGANLFCIKVENCIKSGAYIVKPISSNIGIAQTRDKLYLGKENGFAYGSENDSAAYYDIVLRNSNFDNMTIQEFKTWLSTHNTIVYYILETPYEIDLGEIDEMLLSYFPVTNVFSNIGTALSIEYFSNYKNWKHNVDEYLEKVDTIETEVNKHDKQIVNVSNRTIRMENDLYDSGLEQGDYINVQDSAYSEAQELSVDGVGEQVVTNGYQLLDYKSKFGTSVTSNGVTFDFKNDGTIVANGIATDTAYAIIVSSMDVDGELSISSGLGINNKYYVRALDRNDSYKPILTTVETGRDTATANTSVQPICYVAKGQTANNVVFKPMLEYGSVKHEFEPYTNLQATPNPTYEQPISVLEGDIEVTTCNENLFDKNIPPMNANINTGTKKISLSDTTRLVYIKCKPNITYTISKKISSRFVVGTTSDIPQNNLNINKLISDYSASKITITTEENDKYLNIFYWHGTYDTTITEEEIRNSIQIVVGDNELPYVDHQETKLTLTIPENEFVGKVNETYKDELIARYNESDGNYHAYLVKNVGRGIVDSNNVNSNAGSSVSVLTKRYATNELYNVLSYSDAKVNYLKDNRKGNMYTTDIIGYNFESSKFTFRLPIEIAPNLDTTKNWLNEHNIIFYYPLAQSYEIDLGAIDMPLTYANTTNVFTDSELLPTITLKYYRDFRKTIQSMQVNEKALKEELIDINNRLTALETSRINMEVE